MSGFLDLADACSQGVKESLTFFVKVERLVYPPSHPFASSRPATGSNTGRIGHAFAILLRSENLSQHPRRKERRGSLGRPHTGPTETENAARLPTESRIDP